MAENQESIYGLIERLAIVSDAVGSLFPNGKTMLVFELNKDDFEMSKSNFKNNDKTITQFKVDISGIEFIFLLDGSLIDGINKISENPL